MRITVKVIPRSKKNRVVEEGEGRLKVHLTAPPVEGKANAALIECLAEHFNVKKRQVRIVSGQKSREKVVEIG
jgi:uncharacterized protein (TIGR00251 family)